MIRSETPSQASPEVITPHTIIKPAPFGDQGDYVLRLLKYSGKPVDRIEDTVDLLHQQYERVLVPTAAWFEVRWYGGPGFVGTLSPDKSPGLLEATGFEGLLVGLTDDPEEALNILLEYGLEVVKQQKTLPPSVQREHLDCLRQSKFYPNSVIFWCQTLSALLAKMKARVNQSVGPHGDYQSKQRFIKFKEETYRLVGDRGLRYKVDETKKLNYEVLVGTANRHGGITLPQASVSGYSRELAWFIMSRIGMFAHPSTRYLADIICANQR